MEGQNILGFIEPTADVKQQIIISGHHDSAHIFTYLDKDPEKFPQKMLLANATSFLITIIALLLWIGQQLGFYSIIAIYIFATVFTLLGYSIGQLWFFYDRKGTPGAGDNMISTALAMEVGRYFAEQKEEDKGLEHTRVVVASWDAEEAGLRGSRAYVKDFLSELKEVKTYNLNLECMYDHREMGLLTSDLNSFVTLSEPMVDDCIAISESLNYAIKKVPFPFLAGGTDAAEFAKAGIEATTLAGMHWSNKHGKPAYHTSRDTIDVVDKVAVSMGIELGIEYILRKERDVLSRRN